MEFKIQEWVENNSAHFADGYYETISEDIGSLADAIEIAYNEFGIPSHEWVKRGIDYFTKSDDGRYCIAVYQ